MKRQKLETVIRETLSRFPESATFDVYAFELWREDGTWVVNDGWRIAGHADKGEVEIAARGRWEVFKANYGTKSRVADLEIDFESLPHCIRVDCGFIAFLEIRPCQQVPVK